jgi:hypothetical protein
LNFDIYDEAKVRSEVPSFKDLTPQVKQETTPPHAHPTTKPPMNSPDYQRWWDTMTEKKKLDAQQMEQSKKELEELESKLQQNRDLDKQLANMSDTTNGFPWEEDKRWGLYETKGGGRKLLDDFADSLKHVNKLYTQAFGPSARKVPAHMPRILIRSLHLLRTYYTIIIFLRNKTERGQGKKGNKKKKTCVVAFERTHRYDRQRHYGRTSIQVAERMERYI